ncbi:hypothetical protein HOY80DRAFT_1137015 [Tuber brumale]|nr:hypothetical protein HOY80DRAFT_1137015 [Tuber brumale]
MSAGYELHSSDTVTELVKIMSQGGHPRERCWPAFISEPLTHYDLLYRVPYFSKYQFVVTRKGSLVTYAHTVPFYWSELEEHGPQGYGGNEWKTVSETLPDGGWNWAWRSGMSLHFSNNPTTDLPEAETYAGRKDLVGKQPNAMCALGVTIDPAHRKRGIADALLQNFKDLTRVYGYEAMVMPDRPTRKTEFLGTKMEGYVSWTKSADSGTDEPFHPWSMHIDADIDTLERWTGVRFTPQEALCRKDENRRTY